MKTLDEDQVVRQISYEMGYNKIINPHTRSNREMQIGGIVGSVNLAIQLNQPEDVIIGESFIENRVSPELAWHIARAFGMSKNSMGTIEAWKAMQAETQEEINRAAYFKTRAEKVAKRSERFGGAPPSGWYQGG